jgi:AraC-like DNA-binding protein
VPSWTNATTVPERTASTKGVLRPATTARVADLRRDHPVDEALRPFVERYWSVRWDRTGRPGYRSQVLGHPCVNVSIESGDRPRFGFGMPAALVHGVAGRRFEVDLVGAGRVTAAKFRPGGFTAFTGRVVARDTVVPLTDQLGIPGGRLLSTVLAEPDDEARAAALDAALVPVAPEPAPDYLELLDLLAQMLTDRSLIRVEEVAARAGIGIRALQRLFATYVGIGPKAVLARYRLHDAVAALDSGEVADLAGLAAALGWFDQAHFSRDFRAAVGTSPSEYLQQAQASTADA